MKYIELQEAFETEVNAINNALAKPISIDTEYFLNSALNVFITTRYTGFNPKTESFEQSQKRIDDLRTLIQTHEILVGGSPFLLEIKIPEDYRHLLGVTTMIGPAEGVKIDCWPKDKDGNYILKSTDPIEGTIDTIDRIKENSLSEYHLHYTKARPIKLMDGATIMFHTDGNYEVKLVKLQYMRQPEKIDIHRNPHHEYSDMPEHTHLEIVKLAAKLYIENKGDVRYNTISNEVNIME